MMRCEICEAISKKRVIKFYYEGLERIVQPHVYGKNKTTGKEFLRGYQVGGYSSSGKIPGWRLFDVSKISEIELTDETFDNPAPGYNRNDPQISHIYCRI
jgi:predicted DNA-binding transcriptional regulator YafY